MFGIFSGGALALPLRFQLHPVVANDRDEDPSEDSCHSEKYVAKTVFRIKVNDDNEVGQRPGRGHEAKLDPSPSLCQSIHQFSFLNGNQTSFKLTN